MPPLALNPLAILVAGVVIFLLGGLWYSPVLFANQWVALQGKTMEEMQSMRAGPKDYVQVFLCGLVTAAVLAIIVAHTIAPHDQSAAMHGVIIGALTWMVAGATSYGTALFSQKPRALWAIDTAYNLVSMVVAAVILAVWR